MRPVIAGIGSRKTPMAVCEQMTALGRFCRERDIYVRSGHANGADRAFEQGALDHTIVYLPSRGWNGPTFTRPEFEIVGPEQETWPAAIDLAVRFHPMKNRLLGWVYRDLLVRNSYQVLGVNLSTPVSCIICWTPNGLGIGGTGQALRIAAAWGIPVFDLGCGADVYDPALQFLSTLSPCH